MTSPQPANLVFDDVVIDFAGRRLLRGGAEQPLEPKAFAVLSLLASAPGQVFARDDILDAVWGHRHVTPGVLNRVVTLLRHALGEDAQHPRLLHTLHGTGYRFDLPAQEAIATSAPPPERRAPSDYRDPDIDGASAIPAQDRKHRPWLIPLFVLALLVVAALVWWRNTPPPPVVASATKAAPISDPTLVVMPLKAIGNDAVGRELAEGLGEELIGTLARIDGLRVIARESTAIAAAESTDPTQLTQRLGITHALEGSLQRGGQHLRVRLRLIEAGSGRALWARDFDRDATEVLALQREIAQAVATSLTLKMGLAAGPVAKSGDAEFLRRYLAAQALLRNRGDAIDRTVEPAEAEFRALIRERPDDARAHAGLASALGTRAYRRPHLAAALRAEAMQEAAITQRLDPALPEPYFLQATEACRANRWEPCLTLLEKTTALAPNFYPARYQQAMTKAQLGYLKQAEAIVREDVARDPINPGKRFTLGRILDTAGAHEDAHAQFERSDVFATYGRWFNAVWRNDYAAATRIAERDFDDPALHDTEARRLKASYVASSRALVDPAYWPQAEAEMRKFEAETGLLNFNRVLMPDASAHAPELIGKLDVLRERSYSSWDLLLWTKDLAYLRRDPAFQKYLRDNGILAYWKKHGFPPQCRPQGEDVACD
ncbi:MULTISPECIES: winged helix-turn-helix domain-containing protein [unclassified Pseudoxanthomonas]|uniref:winged helix-turn-helix domain-containing protein n=1 Tax=unclassified Pseudoxanthomonas TaxID=2645906 RepID=UPI003078246B